MEDAYYYWRLNEDLKGSEPAKCQITSLKSYYCGDDLNDIGIEAEGVPDICIPYFGNTSIPWSGDVGPYGNCYDSDNAMLPYTENEYTENMIVDCRADCEGRVWYTNEPYDNPIGLFFRGFLCVLFPFYIICIYYYQKETFDKCISEWIPKSNHEDPREYLDSTQNPKRPPVVAKWRVNISHDNVKAGRKMKISGAQKYNGELVRVVEVLDNDKARVQFETSDKIIRIPRHCLKERGHTTTNDRESTCYVYYSDQPTWRKAHLDLRQKIRGDWRNSDGLLISVEDDVVTFLPSTNSYRLFPFGENRLKLKIGNEWWCYSNQSSEDVLVWTNRGESVIWERRVIPPSVDDLPPSYEHSGLQVEMSAPPAYEHTELQLEANAPPAYDEVGPLAPPAYQIV